MPRLRIGYAQIGDRVAAGPGRPGARPVTVEQTEPETLENIVHRTLGGLAAVTATALLLTACGSADDSAADDSAGETVAVSEDRDVSDGDEVTVQTAAVFAQPDATAPAMTYDPAAIPVGAEAMLTVTTGADSTTVRLQVDGLEPDREFGAHAHVGRCGLAPDDSGPHYQDQADPAAGPDSPSTDPAFANPENELWLDFTTDDHGDAEADAQVPWTFRDGGAESLVIHEHQTATADGEAGTAGDRLACFDVIW